MKKYRRGQKRSGKTESAGRQQWPVRRGTDGILRLPSDAFDVCYGSISYFPAFLTVDEADVLFRQTLNAESWECSPITFFGKTVMQPRDTAFYGTELYTYSDERREPIPWDHDSSSRAICSLKRKIEKKLKLEDGFFNVALCNRYMTGSKYMGYHADDEKSLGETPLIASVSVGAERRFLLRPKPCAVRAPDERIEYSLAHGSLLVMEGETQKYYKHALPKASAVADPRVNITFRRVVNPER